MKTAIIVKSTETNLEHLLKIGNVHSILFDDSAFLDITYPEGVEIRTRKELLDWLLSEHIQEEKKEAHSPSTYEIECFFRGI